MSDYYSHQTPRRDAHQRNLDYGTGSGAGWIWVVFAIIAFIALILVGSSGGPVETTGAPAAPGTTEPAVAAPVIE